MKHPDETGVLFLSRTFPPSTGGMQKFSYELLQHLKEDEDVAVTAFTWGGSKVWLPFVLPYLFIGAALHLLQDGEDIIYGTDGLISPIVRWLGRLFGVKTGITLHGLDITFDNAIYQRLVVPTFKRHDRVMCVSRATAEAAKEAGVDSSKIEVVPNGIDPDEYYREDASRETLEGRLEEEEEITLDLAGKTLLLSVGRLVERKGFHWFVSEVVPELGDDYIYFICGTGGMEKRILERIGENDIDNQVFPLGHVSGELLATLYNVSDALIMPNVTVDGDMEGFGIVALEAASCGT
ncbi:MAG: glycosyltransferase family 4 protein, partial [Candidatus Nanohaloarchaea archaeon]|nr:glycosyltransferase family 4 protein [Candidatus Nanohaloarchaea archaeon]